jgi:hypothetical protein
VVNDAPTIAVVTRLLARALSELPPALAPPPQRRALWEALLAAMPPLPATPDGAALAPAAAYNAARSHNSESTAMYSTHPARHFSVGRLLSGGVASLAASLAPSGPAAAAGGWVPWQRALLRATQERSGGFTEFVALPFIHHNAPVYLAGVARPGSTQRDDRAVHAMARLMLHGAIDHIQCSWVKLGTDGVRTLLQGGCDDIGGTLMEETISRMAGSAHGSRKSVAELEALAAAAGRPARQRTTTYGEVPAERLAAQRLSPVSAAHCLDQCAQAGVLDPCGGHQIGGHAVLR